ncbi:protein FAM163A [Tupaia chinensis]|uniref:protein FAM163A n=1 Tax=Tupaia chinensis TaxID=246437 RepID=UPI0003C8F312|nr:protein FAM163A [Tupaia chinensis]
MTAGTVVITGGILATVILLCIIAVLCYCRLQYYCCPCGVVGSHCTACSPYSSPFYIRTADMVPNGGGGERLFAPTYYKEGGPPSLKLAAPQSYPVTWPGSGRETFTSPRAISTDV